MEFKAVVGNPPYQIMDGGAAASAIPVYNRFVDEARKLNADYVSMIMPARWYAGGKGLDSFRKSMLNDKRIRELVDFPNSTDCFPALGYRSIKGGICYFLWDKNYDDKCQIKSFVDGKCVAVSKRYLKEDGCEIFIRDAIGVSVYNKVKSKQESSFSTIVSARKPFEFPTNFTDFSANKSSDSECVIYANKTVGYIERNKINKNVDWIDKYKLLIPEAIGNADVETDKLKAILAGHNTCCTETYLVIGPFDNQQQAENCNSYINTRFFHYLLALKKITQHTTQKCYEFIPIQSFDEAWNDEKLFKKYGFSKEEITYINNKVWPEKEEK